MSAIRKVLSRGAVEFSRKSRCAPAQRSFSTMFDSREHQEEARYIRNMEAERQAAIRKNVDRILSLEDGHKEKEELVGLLGKYMNNFK
jgi:hypothetical protein